MSERVTEILDIVHRVTKLGKYDSNIIGMAGEIIAEEEYGMRKTKSGTKDIDGHRRGEDRTERSIQVKAWSGARIKEYGFGTYFDISEKADDLLVVLIYRHKSEYEILYHGPTEEVGSETSSGKRRVRIDDLKPRDDIESLISRV